MEQTKALNALEPFLALTKSATSPRAAADLVVRATSAPNTYLFTELLQAPQIQALSASAEFSPYLSLLQVFSYGTFTSYTAAGNLPTLNDAQKLKLRQLSLLTLAKDNGHDDTASPSLAYTSLQSNLGLSTSRELEELVISTVYAGLIDAQLDPKNEQVLINSVSPLRDVASEPGAITGLLSSLRAWAGRCDATLQSLEEQMSSLRAEADRRAAESEAWKAKMEHLVDQEEKGGASSSSSDHQKGGGNNHKQTSSKLTVGAPSFGGGGGSGGNGGRSFFAANGPGRIPGGSGTPSSGGGGGGHNALMRSSDQRFGSKRGASSNHYRDEGEVDDEAMDLDEEYESGDGGTKRPTKRKL